MQGYWVRKSPARKYPCLGVVAKGTGIWICCLESAHYLDAGACGESQVAEYAMYAASKAVEWW